MKILHTSDWHLGQHFIGRSRANEHKKFIDWMLIQIVEHAIDAVIIAGDVFDTGSPPSYARELYNYCVVEINKLDCQLVVLGGNHDSVSMLHESKSLLGYMGTEVIGNVQDDISEQLIELNYAHGDKKGEIGALLCAIPFIRPREVMTSQAGESGEQKQKNLANAIQSHYQALHHLAEKKRDELALNLPIIATGHLTAVGVSVSESKTDSVREIYIGNLEAFNANCFPAADYIALGHIHRAQKVAQSEHIRYCGSPIPLSFDELNAENQGNKKVLIAEFDAGKLSQVTPLEVPTFQPMQVIKGDLTDIETHLNRCDFDAPHLPTWLYIEVNTHDYLSDLQVRINALCKDLNVEVLQLKRARQSRHAHIQTDNHESLSELTPLDVFEKRIAQEVFETESEQQRLARLRMDFQTILSKVQG